MTNFRYVRSLHMLKPRVVESWKDGVWEIPVQIPLGKWLSATRELFKVR